MQIYKSYAKLDYPMANREAGDFFHFSPYGGRTNNIDLAIHYYKRSAELEESHGEYLYSEVLEEKKKLIKGCFIMIGIALLSIGLIVYFVFK